MNFFFTIALAGLILSPGATMQTEEPPPLPDAGDVYPEIPNWGQAKVLHIGDSHVSRGLTAGMRKRLRAAGARYRPEGWVGSRSKSWLLSGRLSRLLRSYWPNVVVITLGTNILRDRQPARHATWVRKLVKRLSGRTCYWLGPPPLLEDTSGFNEMLAVNSMPCRYFDSRSLDIPQRGNGKYHLSRDQGDRWAEMIWRWMNGAFFEADAL